MRDSFFGNDDFFGDFFSPMPSLLGRMNRMLESQGTLKIWCAGMARMMYDKQQAGQLKSPQYNSAIVYNALEDMNILQMGRAELKKKQQQEQMRKTFMDAFED